MSKASWVRRYSCYELGMIGLLGVGLVGCPTSMPPPPSGGTGGAVSFANDVQPIFSARCTTCHRPGTPASSIAGIRINLTAGNAFDSIVNQPSSQRPDLTLVVPGDSANSLLFEKVSSSRPPVGSTMPLLSSPLSANQLATIRDWIDQGALDN